LFALSILRESLSGRLLTPSARTGRAIDVIATFAPESIIAINVVSYDWDGDGRRSEIAEVLIINGMLYLIVIHISLYPVTNIELQQRDAFMSERPSQDYFCTSSSSRDVA